MIQELGRLVVLLRCEVEVIRVLIITQQLICWPLLITWLLLFPLLRLSGWLLWVLMALLAACSATATGEEALLGGALSLFIIFLLLLLIAIMLVVNGAHCSVGRVR